MTYTVSEVVKVLHVTEDTVRRWCREGKLNCTMSSKKHGKRITDHDLIAFGEQNQKYLADIMKMMDPEYNESSADIDRLNNTLTDEISDSNEKLLANIALITSEMCSLHRQLISKNYDLIHALFELQAISNKGEKL